MVLTDREQAGTFPALRKLGVDVETLGEIMAIVGLFNMTNSLANGYQIEPDVRPPVDRWEEAPMRCKPFPRLFLMLLSTFLLLAGPMPLPAGDGTGSPAGSVQVASGLTAHYEYYFNRNALRDSQRTGHVLIALTDSGNLLRFDVASLKLTREWYGSTPVTCLGHGAKGTVLAGFEDGRICRVDPESLALTEVARISGKPQWVGETGKATASRILAVVQKLNWVGEDGERERVSYSVIQDPASRKTVPLEEFVTAFLLDSKGRL